MLRIPSKSDKYRSQLVDSLRILAYKEYKLDNKESGLKGLDLYELFDKEWKEHEIHKMDMIKVKKLIKELEYTEQELIDIRSQYYETRNQYQYEEKYSKNDENKNDENAPF
jgi:hypothetical protein